MSQGSIDADIRCYYMLVEIVENLISSYDDTHKKYKYQLLKSFLDDDCEEIGKKYLQPQKIYAEAIKQFDELYEKMFQCLKENNNNKYNEAFNTLMIPNSDAHFTKNRWFRQALWRYYCITKLERR